MKTKVAIAIGFVLLVIAIAVFVDSLPYSQPKPPSVNTNGLIPIRIEVPMQSNGFSLLVQAGKALDVAENETIPTGGTNWDEPHARDLLARNEPALTLMRQAWSCPFLQVDAITNAEQKFDYLMDWRHLAQLAIAEAQLSFDGGKEAQGFAQATAVIQFGQRIQTADGTYIHYLVGLAVKELGLKCIRQFAGKTMLSATNLISISDQLTDFEASQDALRQTLKIEYVTSGKQFDDMTGTAATNSSFYFQYFIYNPDKSKVDLAGQILATMKALTNRYAIGIAFIPREDTNSSYVRRLWHGNVMGTLLNNMSLDTHSHMLAIKCRENVSVRATRVILALRAFQIVNHKPADSLKELTPTFLETVPLDDFDGKPIRYSPSRKEVYSVGKGLVDWGGLESTNSPDLLFPFNF